MVHMERPSRSIATLISGGDLPMLRRTNSATSRVLTRARVTATVLAVALLVLGTGAAGAAPGDDTQGCAAVTGQAESGNPGIATAAGTPYGYGPCGKGAPGGPR